jgi:glycosyltransferase involved in cell wall biosynthesis
VSHRREKPIRIVHVATVDVTLRFLLLGQLRRLRDEGFEVAAISAPGPWTEDLEREGIRHIPWPQATRAWDPRRDVRAFRSLLRTFRGERFHLVHTHTPKPGVMGRVAARMAGVPCVVNTVHGLYVAPETRLTRKAPVLAVEWAAARFSDLELYQSEEDLAWARRLRLVDGRKATLLGNGTDLARFDPSAVPPERLTALRRELDIPEGVPVVGTVGRLVAEKGYRELLRAARRVRQTVPDVRFLAVAPEDPTKWDAIPQADLEAVRGFVRFTGWRSDVPDLLALMDVFVLPSWREGMPRSAIEAAAMGRPLVLTDIRGCREVARHGIEGLLVPPRDAERLAGAVERLLREPELRNRLGVAARRRAVERFDERAVADRVVAGYRRVLARKGLPLPEQEDLDR